MTPPYSEIRLVPQKINEIGQHGLPIGAAAIPLPRRELPERSTFETGFYNTLRQLLVGLGMVGFVIDTSGDVPKIESIIEDHDICFVYGNPPVKSFEVALRCGQLMQEVADALCSDVRPILGDDEPQRFVGVQMDWFSDGCIQTI